MDGTTRIRINSLILAAALTSAAQAYAGGADTSEYMMSDFESGQILGTPLNGYWYNYTDKNTATAIDTVYGNSRITSFDSSGFPFTDSMGYYDARTFPVGRAGDSGTHSLRIAYALGDRKLSCGAACSYDPYIGFGMRFTTNADTLDLTGATAITFWAKSEDSTVVVDVSVGTRDTTTGASDYSQSFTIGKEWKQYEILLVTSAVFKQPAWAARKPFDPKVATGVNFGISLGANPGRPENGILVDDLAVRNWVYVDPNTIPDALVRRAASDYGGGVRSRPIEGGLRISLPEAYGMKRGRIEAVDAGGRVLGSSVFSPRMAEVDLLLPQGRSSGRIMLRIVAKR